MGAQASKAARRLPTKPKAETLENVPTATPSSIAGSQAVSMADIESQMTKEDMRDPHLHKHLQELGQVKIPPTITKMRTSDTMLGIIKQRHAAEETELKPGAGSSNGMMPVDSLHSLMEQRKRMAPGEIDKPEIRKLLMDKYKVDDHSLTLLLKNYNTMAVMPVSLDDKSERRLGIWVNDKMDWEKNVTAVEDRNIAIKKARQAAIKDNAKAQKDDKERDEKRLNDLFDESY